MKYYVRFGWYWCNIYLSRIFHKLLTRFSTRFLKIDISSELLVQLPSFDIEETLKKSFEMAVVWNLLVFYWPTLYLSGLKIEHWLAWRTFYHPDLLKISKLRVLARKENVDIFSSAFGGFMHVFSFIKINSLIVWSVMAKNSSRSDRCSKNILIEEKKCYRNNFRFSVAYILFPV